MEAVIGIVVLALLFIVLPLLASSIRNRSRRQDERDIDRELREAKEWNEKARRYIRKLREDEGKD